MENFDKENSIKLRELLSTTNAKINDEVGEILSDVDERIVEAIIDFDESKDQYQLAFTTRHKVYLVNFDSDSKKNKLESIDKDGIVEAQFIQGLPVGRCTIQFASKGFSFTNIISGRVFDFIQDIKPKEINHANYDNTVRGEFHQLLDPDHAEEIDKLRKYMQEGNISHYEYDDINPAISKAGK